MADCEYNKFYSITMGITMNKYMPILILMTSVAMHASDVWNSDEQFYRTYIRPQVKDIHRTRQSYEHLLGATKDYAKNVRNPFYTVKRTKEMPAEIRELQAKKRLTGNEQDRLRELKYNYEKNLQLMNELQRENANIEVGRYHPDVTEFIGSYKDKDLSGHQEAIRRKIQEHKLSSLWPLYKNKFNGFTVRMYNYWYNRK